jgi:hypothetical protein
MEERPFSGTRPDLGKFARLDRFPALGQCGDLIAAAHVPQLYERGYCRRGDDDEGADRCGNAYQL